MFTLLMLASLMLMLVLLTGLIFAVFLGFWYLLDSSSRPRLRSSGIVTQKSYTSASEYMMPIQSGQSTIFIPQKIPESYNLLIKIDAGYG